MTYQVIFSHRAELRLTDLYDYIAEAASPDIAISYVRRIREACERLSQLPERGQRHEDILPGLRVIGFERRVSIAFIVRERQVEIVTIADGGRDFLRELRSVKEI